MGWWFAALVKKRSGRDNQRTDSLLVMNSAARKLLACLSLLRHAEESATSNSNTEVTAKSHKTVLRAHPGRALLGINGSFLILALWQILPCFHLKLCGL